MIIIVARLKSG